jgi:exopolyphosphatase/guanosine-5'-triphosphate,3'-diphosphate pyrophosphatase
MGPWLKFAAIDIGSNAVRLLLACVFDEGPKPTFKKMALVRMPIRLGDDAFTRNRITETKAAQLVKTMVGFQHLIEAYEPIETRAFATSAMRDARNGSAICARIRKACGIEVEIIDGKREAQLIFENKSAERVGGFNAYLYVDVGGGSTDITLFSQGRIVTSGSFNIGTIRLLENLVPAGAWRDMRQWIRSCTTPYASLAAIGSGGNVNKLSRMANCKNGKPLSFSKMLKVRHDLNQFSLERRITELGLRPDRADVIVPAADIYLKVMKWAKIRSMFVPVVGLADGVVHILYQKHKSRGAAGASAGKRLPV